jgi:hypothetical protein
MPEADGAPTTPVQSAEPAPVQSAEPAPVPAVYRPPVVVEQPLGLLLRSLSGIETGMFGGVVTLVWLLSTGWLLGAPGWVIPNLMAAPFHGPRSLTADFSFVTLSGVALHLLQCGLAAVAFAWWASPAWPAGRSVALGLMLSLVAHGLMEAFLLNRWNPDLLSYAPPFVLWTGGVLFGIVLGCTPWRLRSIRRDFLLD